MCAEMENEENLVNPCLLSGCRSQTLSQNGYGQIQESQFWSKTHVNTFWYGEADVRRTRMERYVAGGAVSYPPVEKKVYKMNETFQNVEKVSKRDMDFDNHQGHICYHENLMQLN